MKPNIKEVVDYINKIMEKELEKDADDPIYCSWEITIKYRDASEQDLEVHTRKHTGIFADGEILELD